MREIKFRAWNTTARKMAHFDMDWFIENIDEEGLRFPGDAGMFNNSELNSFELMQYTGLKDNNGKDIYESDIVSVPCRAVGVVVYEQPEHSNQFLYFVKGDGWIRGIDGVSVIGNVYENPELLKEDR